MSNQPRVTLAPRVAESTTYTSDVAAASPGAKTVDLRYREGLLIKTKHSLAERREREENEEANYEQIYG